MVWGRNRTQDPGRDGRGAAVNVVEVLTVQYLIKRKPDPTPITVRRHLLLAEDEIGSCQSDLTSPSSQVEGVGSHLHSCRYLPSEEAATNAAHAAPPILAFLTVPLTQSCSSSHRTYLPSLGIRTHTANKTWQYEVGRFSALHRCQLPTQTGKLPPSPSQDISHLTTATAPTRAVIVTQHRAKQQEAGKATRGR